MSAAAPTREALVARRVRKGSDAAGSRELLADLERRHRGANLAHALAYQGFATERGAHAYAAALELEGARP